MFCEHCGKKIEGEALFCHNCGKKIENSSHILLSVNTDKQIQKKDGIFYSKDWRQKKVLSIVSLPYFDVMADTKYLYLIKMPKYNEGALFAALGFLLLFLIGALIGGHLGAKKDTKKRQYYRSAWVDSESNLISYEYTGDIFLQIPLEALRGTLVLSGNKFAINYSGVMITLQMGYQKEFDRFKQYIEKYVL